MGLTRCTGWACLMLKAQYGRSDQLVSRAAMDRELSWAAWNRLFDDWTKAERNHKDLHVYARIVAATNPRLAAATRDLAMIEGAVAVSAQCRMRQLMIVLLARSAKPD